MLGVGGTGRISAATAQWNSRRRGRSSLTYDGDKVGSEPLLVLVRVPGVDPDQLGVQLVHREPVHLSRHAGDVDGQAEVVGEGLGEGGDT